MLKNKNILLGVTGGIAVYKACALTSKLTQKGANVKVVMTNSATQFVPPLTFQALSRNPVYTDTFDEKDASKIAHIDLADWADIVILAPATANMIGKIAGGIADDLLSTILLATQAPVYIAPAMNVHMYEHPAVIRNMKMLADWGYKFIEPGDGYLACGYVGKGRLEEPETIVSLLERDTNNDHQWLKGKKLLISAGPTREGVDPVRFFTNHSSGKMGVALAEVAAEAGADVTLVTGPISLSTSSLISRINVQTAEEMHQEMVRHFPNKDIVIKAAAVADYRPKTTYDHKMKKQKGDLVIEMERTVDILKELGRRKQSQFLVGFAAETDNIVAYAKKKISEKHLDAIVVNDITTNGAGFATDTNQVTYLNKHGMEKQLELATKQDIAKEIYGLIAIDMAKGEH